MRVIRILRIRAVLDNRVQEFLRRRCHDDGALLPLGMLNVGGLLSLITFMYAVLGGRCHTFVHHSGA